MIIVVCSFFAAPGGGLDTNGAPVQSYGEDPKQKKTGVDPGKNQMNTDKKIREVTEYE